MKERRDVNTEFLDKKLSRKGKTRGQTKSANDFKITEAIADYQKHISGLLKRKENNKLIQSVENVEIVWDNDPILKRYYPALNLFTSKIEKHNRDASFNPDDINFGAKPDLWTDSDTKLVKRYLSKYYGLCPQAGEFELAFSGIATLTAYHPIEEYLASCYEKWDGQSRVERLFTEFLGVEDDPVGYARTVTKLWFIAAVKRVFEPGCKFDNVLCLLGGQGIGKSTLLHKIATPRYFSNSLNELKSKDAKEALLGKWILELAEGTFMHTTNVEQAKQFFSAQEDNWRRAYEKFETESERHCVFAVTSNNVANFLADQTGNRRFWILECEDEQGERSTKKSWIDLTPEYRDQLWGEAVDMYLQGYQGDFPEKSLALEKGSEVEQYAMELQENNCFQNTHAETLERFLDMGLPEKGTMIRVADANGKQVFDADKKPMFRETKGWSEMSPQERYLYFTMGDAKGGHNENGKQLTGVCYDMAKQECFGIFGTRNEGKLRFQYDMAMKMHMSKKGWIQLKETTTRNGKKPGKSLPQPYNTRKGKDVYVIKQFGM